MPSAPSKKILLVPLDWGLGHTTRCIPIIQELLALGHDVHLGGAELSKAILKEEFPNLPFYEFPSYGISYPKKGNQFMKHIVGLLPQINKAIRFEKKRTHQLMVEHTFDIIFSDNRFGVRADGAINIILSHQLNLLVPQSKLVEKLANFCNAYFINKFDRVAVPDFKTDAISGDLSNSSAIKPDVFYLGTLSRWSFSEQAMKSRKGILVILSGPEPQRTLLEYMIIDQADETAELTIVRALPQTNVLPKSKNIKFYNHLPSAQLRALVEKSEIVVSRAGYTTIMDLIAVKKNAILIPTPGQTEQEYLGRYLERQNLFLFYGQKEFDLQVALKDYKEKKWNRFPSVTSSLSEKLINLMS
jgi:UDP:flavonoid glycosyltransferase YjiC (YdhE family)